MKTRRILALVLSLCMIFTMLPTITLTASAAETECEHTVGTNGYCTLCMKYGYCGEVTTEYPKGGPNVTWTLDDNGLLTISGSGAMGSSYSYNSFPDIRSNIKKVVVKNGVSSLCDSAFAYLGYLTEATIEGDLDSVGKNAFWDTNDGEEGTTVYFNGNVKAFGEKLYYGKGYNFYVYYNGTTVPEFSGEIYGYSKYSSDVLKIYVTPKYYMQSTKFYNYMLNSLGLM